MDDSDVEQTQWKYNEERALRPVTLRQVAEATRSHDSALFTIDGRSVKAIQIVATLLEEDIHQDRGFVRYMLDDGTNRRPIIARSFARGTGTVTIESVLQTIPDQPPLSQPYVSIVGVIDQYMGINSIKVDSVRVVTDHNQVFHHILNVVVTHLHYEKGPPPPSVLHQLSSRALHAQGEEYSALLGEEEEAVGRETPFPDSSPPSGPPPSLVADSFPARPIDVEGSVPHTPKKKARRDIQTSGASPYPSGSTSVRRKIFRMGIVDVSPERSAGEQPDTPTRPRNSRRATPARAHSPTVEAASPSVARENRRLSRPGRDPLSHISLLGRKILLFIMDETHPTRDVYVAEIVQALRNEGNVTPHTIGEALDELLDAYLIESTDDAKSYYRAVDIKGKKKAYNLQIE